MKRTSSSFETKSKRRKVDEINAIKKIIIRNDNEPFVYTNIACDYVKIGEFVYKVKPYNESWNKINIVNPNETISLTLSQYNDISPYVFDEKILITNFSDDAFPIKKTLVNLTSNTSFKIISKKEDIMNHILSILVDHVVSLEQNFTICYQGIIIKINIVDIGDMTMGKITENTEIDFEYFDNNIIICNKCINIDSKSVKIYVTKCIDINIPINVPENTNEPIRNSHLSKFPLIIDQKTLNRYVKDAFSNTFTNNETINYRIDGFEFSFNIRIVGFDKQTKYKNTYKLKKDNDIIYIQSNTDNVIITEDTKKAERICFEIVPIPFQKYDMDNYILVVDDIINYIKKNITSFTLKQVFKYQIKTKEINLKINYVNPLSSNNIKYKIIPDETKIVFNNDSKSKFILVNNAEPIEIIKVIFKLKSTADFFSLFMKSGNNKTQIFDAKKLEKIVKNIFPKKTALKHEMKLTYNGNDYIIVVKSLIFKNKDDMSSNKKKYSTYGFITENTEFKFVTSKKNKSFTINNTTKTELINNPIEELEKYVGGISEELKIIIRTICLSRGKLREEFIARELKADKGIIFHGPPGTGKTCLARNLGKILGCEGERFVLMSGPEVFNKWVGESEANIRAIFKPAKEAWKKYGINAPVYMVVIDEIDAMIPSRNGTSGNPVRDSVVNQFLAEMDGLEQFNNLICIGITNRLELIDPAAIRAGRFGVHVKIDLPDKKGRIKIFEIYTKKLKEINRLKNIDYDKLADLTEKFSGADIENIVKLASTYSLERLNNIDVINNETIEKHGCIVQDDFIKAINETSKMNRISDSNNFMHMYI